MENESGDNRKKGYMLRRAVMDYGMGVIIFGIGLFILVAPKLGFDLNVSGLSRYLLGGLFLLYGGFRIYRGSQKDYFRD